MCCIPTAPLRRLGEQAEDLIDFLAVRGAVGHVSVYLV